MSLERTPRLAEPAEVAGRWRMETKGDGCGVSLTAESVVFPGPDAAGWRLTGDDPCLATLHLRGVEAWRPSSDGIALLRADGSLVVFLGRKGQGFEGPGPDGERLRLVRD
jgi:hypothetical protein